jgi:hypothetical protein
VKWKYMEVPERVGPAGMGAALVQPNLKDIGEKGWELVTIYERGDARIWVFKMEVQHMTASEACRRTGWTPSPPEEIY